MSPHLTEERNAALSITENSIDFLSLFNDLWRLLDLLSEDVALDEVGKPYSQLVGDELFSRHRKDFCIGCQRVSDFIEVCTYGLTPRE